MDAAESGDRGRAQEEGGIELKKLLRSVAAGFLIGAGGIANLKLGGIGGAFLFSLGLFFVCCNDLLLYTGKIANFYHGLNAQDLAVILFGNAVGACLAACVMCFTRYEPELRKAASDLVDVKMADSTLSLILLGVMCNILIYLAVSARSRTERFVGLAIVFGVMGFVVCGFEHCVADVFYFAMAGELGSANAARVLLSVIVGNTVGGLLCGAYQKILIRGSAW